MPDNFNNPNPAPVLSQKPVCIGISQGDINGIGLEVIIKTFSEPAMLEVCTPVLFSSAKTLGYHRKAVNAEQFNYNILAGFDSISPRKFNLFNCYNEEVNIEIGKSTANGGKYAVKSLITACDALQKGKIDALVTAPINKHNSYSDIFPFAGHTQYLDDRFGKGNSIMMLVSLLLPGRRPGIQHCGTKPRKPYSFLQYHKRFRDREKFG